MPSIHRRLEVETLIRRAMAATFPIDEEGNRIIRIGHSPDPDDAFMFHALTTGLINTPGYSFIHELQDIETLNHRAMNSELEVSAISIHSFPEVSQQYALMNCGASMGEGYGPMVVALNGKSMDDVKSGVIAVPGLKTSAYLGLRLAWGDIQTEVIAFDEIFDAVIERRVDAGLIIHEGQLTYAEHGLEVHLDLGVWWAEKNRGWPMPLRGNIVRKDLGMKIMSDITKWTKQSIEYAISNPEQALAFAKTWGRGIDDETNEKFVSMYVNQRTIDYGPDGRDSVKHFLKQGQIIGLINSDFDTEEMQFIGSEV